MMRSSSSWSDASATGRPIRPRVAVDVEHDLLDPARARAGDVDVLDLDVALRQPRDGLGDVAPERRLALDASAHRVMDLGHAGERADERVDLSAQQALVERHRSQTLAPAPVEDALQHRRREELWRERHARSIPWTSSAAADGATSAAGVGLDGLRALRERQRRAAVGQRAPLLRPTGDLVVEAERDPRIAEHLLRRAGTTRPLARYAGLADAVDLDAAARLERGGLGAGCGERRGRRQDEQERECGLHGRTNARGPAFLRPSRARRSARVRTAAPAPRCRRSGRSPLR